MTILIEGGVHVHGRQIKILVVRGPSRKDMLVLIQFDPIVDC